MSNGKAENLNMLAAIGGVNVPRFVVLRPSMSADEQETLVRNFLQTNREKTVAVRSSADQEDSVNASFAGMYTTKLRVPATIADIMVAVAEVQSSGRHKESVVAHYASHRGIACANASISVIVQEMIEADKSGVIFSHSLTRHDGYYAISVSTGIGETIVGGAANGTFIRIARGVTGAPMPEAWLRKLTTTMRTIEQRFQSTSLDVEFAVRDNTLYILQCRPITTVPDAPEITQEETLLERIALVNTLIAARYPGDVLGDMIDINPVELLGVSPTPLDVSIFKYLFADRIVEQVRRDMGYDPLDRGLLEIIAGKPYASMRATAFSFRPRGIDHHIYERMVQVYRTMLENNPALQSRVEFDVYAMSCGEKLDAVMHEAQLNEQEQEIVRAAFKRIDTVFSSVSMAQAETFDAFATDYAHRTASMGDTSLDQLLQQVAHGTTMFVRVARLAFYWKNKFEELYPQAPFNSLIDGHIHSVNGQLQTDLAACRKGVITKEAIVATYGHLRPGQFSVLGESYADDPDTYLFAHLEQAEEVSIEKQAHAFEQTTAFQHAVTFMQARERMKFLFSQSLHLYATKLKGLLTQRGFEVGEASCMSCDQLHTWLQDATSVPHHQGPPEPTLVLPDVIIAGRTDLRVVTFSEALPSYITSAIVKARVCVLDRVGVKADFTGALVLLPNADPGYDFLFHSGAVGIITKVGGPASHMCIRSIELQMPACIGCGESVYQKLAVAHTALLDCHNRQIIVLD